MLQNRITSSPATRPFAEVGSRSAEAPRGAGFAELLGKALLGKCEGLQSNGSAHLGDAQIEPTLKVVGDRLSATSEIGRSQPVRDVPFFKLEVAGNADDQTKKRDIDGQPDLPTEPSSELATSGPLLALSKVETTQEYQPDGLPVVGGEPLVETEVHPVTTVPIPDYLVGMKTAETAEYREPTFTNGVARPTELDLAEIEVGISTPDLDSSYDGGTDSVLGWPDEMTSNAVLAEPALPLPVEAASSPQKNDASFVQKSDSIPAKQVANLFELSLLSSSSVAATAATIPILQDGVQRISKSEPTVSNFRLSSTHADTFQSGLGAPFGVVKIEEAAQLELWGANDSRPLAVSPNVDLSASSVPRSEGALTKIETSSFNDVAVANSRPTVDITVVKPSPEGVLQLLSQPALTVATAIRENSNWSHASSPSAVSVTQTSSSDGTVLQSMRVQLNPAELGKVDLNLRMQQGQLQIEVKVETEQAHRALLIDQDALMNTIRSLGYRVENLVIGGPNPDIGSQTQHFAQANDQRFHGEKDGQRTSERTSYFDERENDSDREETHSQSARSVGDFI